jgi:hypothetical protein
MEFSSSQKGNQVLTYLEFEYLSSHYKWSADLEMQAESLYKVSFSYEDKS